MTSWPCAAAPARHPHAVAAPPTRRTAAAPPVTIPRTNIRAPPPIMTLAPFASLSRLLLIVPYPVCSFSETAQGCCAPPDAGPGRLGQRGHVLQWMGEVIFRGIADDISVRALWEEVQRLLSEEVHRVGLRHHDARSGRTRGCRGTRLRGHRCRQATRR